MDKIKVLFDSHHFQTPKHWIESIIRFTPNSKGIWKNIEYTLDPKKAQFYFIMDGPSQKWPNMKEKAIFFGEHPNTPGSPVEKLFNQWEALLKLPLKDFLNPHEIWLSSTYDDLIKLLPPNKTKNLVCVATYQIHNSMYAQRQVFLRQLVTLHPELGLELYGRNSDKYIGDKVLKSYYKGCLGNNNFDATKGEHIIGKDDILAMSNFSIEFDVGPTKNYFSERWCDALLMWCTPIYFGSNNPEEFYPYKNRAYYTFDQHNLDDVNEIARIRLYEPQYHDEIAEIRKLILNKYQLWAYCHHIVNNIEAYLTDAIGTHKKWIKESLTT